jgi:nicotinamide-nucleotide amidase
MIPPSTLPKIETLAIGDELLIGKISDTNSTFISNQLFALGLSVRQTTLILDREEDIEKTLLEISKRADYAVCFGGLGPTSDDRTVECVAKLANSKKIMHNPSYERLKELYTLRKREITPQALKQVYYPELARPLSNSKGMAPGFEIKIGNCVFYFLPGVPTEMKAIFQDHMYEIFSKVSGQHKLEKVFSHTWRCMGIFESDLQKLMDPIEEQLPKNAWLGYRTVFPENHLTLYYRAQKESEDFNPIKEKMSRLVRSFSYSEKNEELEQVIVNTLIDKKKTIAFAESCTGGLCSQRLTRVIGCSKVLWGGLNLYQFSSKNSLLDLDIQSAQDAMSLETSNMLAERIKQISKCSIAVSITGALEENGMSKIYMVILGDKKIEREMTLAPRSRYELQWGASSQVLSLVKELLFFG